MVRPVCAEQIGLLDEVEELVRRPLWIGEAPILRIGRRHRAGCFAGQALGGRAPEIEIGPAEPRLQFDRPARIGQPVVPTSPSVLTMSVISSESPAWTWPSSRGLDRPRAPCRHPRPCGRGSWQRPQCRRRRLVPVPAQHFRCWRDIVLHGHPRAPRFVKGRGLRGGPKPVNLLPAQSLRSLFRHIGRLPKFQINTLNLRLFHA